VPVLVACDMIFYLQQDERPFRKMLKQLVVRFAGMSVRSKMSRSSPEKEKWDLILPAALLTVSSHI
jgi:hypothetical protein